MKTLLLTIIWNEEKLLPFFLKYYNQIVDKYIFIDYGSTDNSFKIIRENALNNKKDTDFVTAKWHGKYDEREATEIKNTFWIKERNCYDWIIVVDTDEFLYYPKGLFELQMEMIELYNIVKPQGFNMVSDKFPVNDILEIKHGVPEIMENKSVMFRNWIEPNYNHGCHECKPVPAGYIKPFESPELKLLHYKYVDIEYQIKRKNLTAERLSQTNRENGWGVQNWTGDEVWRQKFKELKEKAENII